jgi:hypothetical protein
MCVNFLSLYQKQKELLLADFCSTGQHGVSFTLATFIIASEAKRTAAGGFLQYRSAWGLGFTLATAE